VSRPSRPDYHDRLAEISVTIHLQVVEVKQRRLSTGQTDFHSGMASNNSLPTINKPPELIDLEYRLLRLQAIRPAVRSGNATSLRPVTPLFQSSVFLNSSRSLSWSAPATPDTGAAATATGSLPANQATLAIPDVNGEAERTVTTQADPSAMAATDGASGLGPVNPEVPHMPTSVSSTSNLPPAPKADGYTDTDPSSILPQPPATADVPTIESLIAANPDNIADVLASPEAVHAAMKIGDLKLMGLTHGVLNPAGWIRDALEAIHVGMGIPWWGTIMITTACLRLALFPLVVRMQAHNSRMSAIQDQQKVLMEKMTEAKGRGDQQAGQVYAAQLAQLWKEHDVHPVRSLGLPMLQMPLFLAFFFAIRKLVALPVPQLKEGGLAWFTDLTVADPYYILPVTSMALTLAVMQMGADGTGSNKSRQNQHTINVFRVATVLAIPFVAHMASVSGRSDYIAHEYPPE
jgi:YidC/Oxa1 family membrane protein insertase